MRKARFLGIIAAIILCLVVEQTAAQGNQPQPISYGQTVTGQLSNAQVEVLYIFTAQQGDAITVTEDKVNGNIDPLVILVDQSQQTVLAVDNDSGGDRNARLRYVVPSAGSYIIRATAVQGSGDINGTYKLTLTLGNPAAPTGDSTAPLIAPLAPDKPVQGTLSDTVKFRIYAIHAQKDEPITASLDVTQSADNLQVGQYLYTSDFREIGRAELGQSLSVRTPADGVYFLMVARASDSGSGTYTLRPSGAANSNALTIAPGQTVRGEIAADTAVRSYSLQGGRNQSITVRMRRLSGDLTVFTYLVALDSGKSIAQASDVNGVAEFSTVLPAAGSYAVIATRQGQQNGKSTGTFALSISQPNQATPLPSAFQNYISLEYGDHPNGSIDDTTFAVPYVFTASGGDVIQVTMTASDGTLDPYLILQNVKGDTLAEAGAKGKSASLQFTIPLAGSYGLIAARNGVAKGKTQGKFDLAFSTVASAPGSATYGTTLVAGQPQAGASASVVGALYRFDANANSAASVTLEGGNPADYVVMLTDSDFNQLNASAQAVRETLLTKQGTYYVIVARAGGANAPAGSNYTVRLQGTTNPAPTSVPGTLAIGQTVTGTISSAIYQQRYTIQLRAGTSLIVSMDAAPGSKLDPMVGLVDAANNLIGLNDDAGKGLKNALLTVAIPKDGLYTIVATRSQEAQGSTEGDFVLKVQGKQVENNIQPLPYGASVSGEITPQRFLIYYSFKGTEGDVITIRMTHLPGATLDPLLYLYDYSTGKPNQIAVNDNEKSDGTDAGIVSFKLPNTGAYLIAATRAGIAQGTTQGGFTLNLTKEQ